MDEKISKISMSVLLELGFEMIDIFSCVDEENKIIFTFYQNLKNKKTKKTICKNGELQSFDGFPSFVEYKLDEKVIKKIYHKKGKVHTTFNPTLINGEYDFWWKGKKQTKKVEDISDYLGFKYKRSLKDQMFLDLVSIFLKREESSKSLKNILKSLDVDDKSNLNQSVLDLLKMN